MLIIKKAVSAVLVMCFIWTAGIPARAEAGMQISADKAILVHESGKVLYAKNEDIPALIASTTKIMTAIVVLENCSTDEIVEIRPESCGKEGSSMYLKAGEKFTVRQLLEGMLLISGNDAASALAIYCAGSEKEFAGLMNKKARELKMENSHFENPHGLDSKEHYSSAADLAKLMLYCMKNPEFREITAMRSGKVDGKTIFNHNKLLKLCKGCRGGKTGYTMAAGRCLVSCCERQGMRLVCVTLSAPDDWNDHIKLYNRAYNDYRYVNTTENVRYSVPAVSGDREEVNVRAEDFYALLSADEKTEFRAQLPFFVFAPVSAGEKAGKIKIYAAGELLGEAELYFENGLKAAA